MPAFPADINDYWVKNFLKVVSRPEDTRKHEHSVLLRPGIVGKRDKHRDKRIKKQGEKNSVWLWKSSSLLRGIRLRKMQVD
jgi:hypothetical protein